MKTVSVIIEFENYPIISSKEAAEQVARRLPPH